MSEIRPVYCSLLLLYVKSQQSGEISLYLRSKIEKVPRGSRGEKSSKTWQVRGIWSQEVPRRKTLASRKMTEELSKQIKHTRTFTNEE